MAGGAVYPVTCCRLIPNRSEGSSRIDPSDSHTAPEADGVFQSGAG